MKKLLLVFVALAIYLHFYPKSDAAIWIDQQKELLLEKFSEVTDTQVRLSAKKVYSDIERQFDSFSSEEKVFVENVTQSRQSIVQFFTEHCGNSRNSSRLHAENQKKVCKVISQYQSLF